jgi:NAD(P)-dependent dehydrogenase (short-subunit alcohol dehydrogenase family)
VSNFVQTAAGNGRRLRQRSPDRTGRGAPRCSRRSRPPLALPADLTRDDEIVELFATVEKTFGRLDVLVNNAGIATHRETEDISLDYWCAALDINITATFCHSRP